MSTSATDPEAVPAAWRLEGVAKVTDQSGDGITIKRFGDRMQIETHGRFYGFPVVFPNDADSATLDALEQVVEQMQAFLRTARER